MKVLVDTSIWSLAYRRAAAQANPLTQELARLIRSRQAFMIGAIRQELLSGIRDPLQFEALRQMLRQFPDLPLQKSDYEAGAEFYNRCRVQGVQGSLVDLLICAVAVRRSLAIFSADQDFEVLAQLLPIRLHEIR